MSKKGSEWQSQRCLVPASSLSSQPSRRKYGRWGGQSPAVVLVYTNLLTLWTVFSWHSVWLAGLPGGGNGWHGSPGGSWKCLTWRREKYQSSLLSIFLSSLLCNFWIWRHLVMRISLIFGCYHQILQLLRGESGDSSLLQCFLPPVVFWDVI